MKPNVSQLAAHLHDLYQRQLASSDSPYLRAHTSTRGGLLRQVRAAALYLPHVAGRVLDWGCFHAPDACLVRAHCGPALEIHGCDIHPPDLDCFPEFHRAAGLHYRQTHHPYQLPYDDDFFDTVIADGVLEHVPNDQESLKELYRVLKPDGLLIISCLPNAISYLETLAWMLSLPYHLRSYTMRQAKSLLLHHGFEPVRSRYLQMTPTLSGMGMVSAPGWLRLLSSLLWTGNSVLERLWPINRLASNLFVLARKRLVIAWTPAPRRQPVTIPQRQAA